MKKYILYTIILIATVLRMSSLETYPFGFTPDEASFAYDAYSILNTGSDQWGNSYPLVLKSFGDYKPPLYSYLSIPSVAILGLTKVSARITNSIFGVLAVIITYFLAGELGRRSGLSSKNTDRLQIVSALLLAVSPWHIMMSRGAFEANLTTFIMPLGIYLFLRSFEDNKWLFASSLVFGFNLFSYHSARLVTPLIVFVLLVLFWRKLRDVDKKTQILSAVTFLVFISFAFYTLTLGGAQRAKDISIFSGSAQAAAGNRLIALERGIPFPIARVLHNKYVVSSERFIENYVQYTSYRFLFKEGPAEETYGMMPGMGVTYWFVFPFILFFLFYIYKKPKDKYAWIIVLWLILAPIPAALTTGEGYAANRAVIMLPALQIIFGYGAVKLFDNLETLLSPDLYKLFKYSVLVIALISVLGFIEKYFILSPHYVADGMLYGRYEAAELSPDAFDKDREVVVSTGLSEPHIYYAFTQEMDPKVYQSYSQDWDLESTDVDWVDQLPQYRLGRYLFKNIEWNRDSAVYSNFVGLPEDFPKGIEPNGVLYYPNFEPAVYLINSTIDSYAYNNN